MDGINLKGMANGISQRKFKAKFDGKVKLSDKLLSLRQYGRYVPESNTIYLASQFFANVKRSTPTTKDTPNDLIDKMYNFGLRVLEHELAHWYCYKHGIEYHDGTTPFEDFLEKHQCITNGNYPLANKKLAFIRNVEPLYCKGCGKPQFDRLSDVSDALKLSHCCDRECISKGVEKHRYYYYDYKSV